MKLPFVLILCSFSSLAASESIVANSTKSLANSGSTVSRGTLKEAPLLFERHRKPPLSLAENFRANVRLADYLISEKYDGARVWWDGHRLLSRGGNEYHAPAWFTDALPDAVLDGELWTGRGQFQQLMQTIRDQQPDDEAWRAVHFMVFDAPAVNGGFRTRQTALMQMLSATPSDWIKQVPQHEVASPTQLQQMLKHIVSNGGEGLMLQRADMAYTSGRHSGFLKLKPYQDDEAVVVGYRPGRGKYTGMTGSLIVKDASGIRFKLGSGLTDADRKSPPPIGAQVTYRYQGRTESGKPRFARFLRERNEE